nr:MAG TPA: hypothetical protein [Caudoviricetes sp.]
MEKSPKTKEELYEATLSLSFERALYGYSLAKAMQEELADFISQSTKESKEEIIKRINERTKKIAVSVCKSDAESLGVDPDKIALSF